jgi:hypothetical protein
VENRRLGTIDDTVYKDNFKIRDEIGYLLKIALQASEHIVR